MIEAIPGKSLESEITLFSQGSLIKGDVSFDRMTRLHGRVEGKVHGLKDSVIVVGETATVHGEMDGDEIIIDGFVHGNVRATSKVTVTESGKLIGNVKAPVIEIKFGAHFEGQATTTRSRDTTYQSAPGLVADPNMA